MNRYLSLIKFSHTIFALPFAMIGFALAVLYEGFSFQWPTLLWVLLCMVFARSAAMAFNRWADRKIDGINPRTAIREIPAGIIHPNSALAFTAVNSGLFVVAAGFLNTLCLALSPVALLVVLGYSYTKRFTPLCHLVLGLGLSLAPIGAWLAVTGRFDWLPLFFSVVVFLWVAGFDIIYALQDEEFDKANGLYSIPARLGKVNALRLSRLLHFFTAITLLSAGFYAGFGWIYWLGVTLFCSLLIMQHRLVSPNDLGRVNLAFFTTNGVASVAFSVFVLMELWVNSTS